MAPTEADEAAILDVSEEEAARLFDTAVAVHLGMSSEEFVRLVREGQPLPRHPMTGHLLLMIGARPH